MKKIISLMLMFLIVSIRPLKAEITVAELQVQVDMLNYQLQQLKQQTQLQISGEATQRFQVDTAINAKIVTESDERKNDVVTLENLISDEASLRDEGDKSIQSSIESVLNTTDVQNNKLNNETNQRIASDKRLNERIEKLNETKVVGEIAVRVFDTRHFVGEVFDNYDFRHNKNNEVGFRLSYKLGRSYETLRADEDELHIKELQEEVIELRNLLNK